MKCFIAIALLALFAVVYADERQVEHEKLAPHIAPAQPDVPRDKRGVLLSYGSPYLYSAPIGYSSFNSPYGYRYPYYYSSYSWV